MASKPSIAIIGAGPAGATLGRILHLASVPFTIFEGEASASIRNQGSTLDLHYDTGLAAIKECDLWDEFSKLARYDGEATKMVDKYYKIYLETGAGSEGDFNETSRPEIDRTVLRELLVKSLPAAAIKWNHRVRSVGEDGTLHFDHGTEGPFDLIVGADGAWSKIRPKLTDIKPYYTGIGGVAVTIDNPDVAHPDLYKEVNRGSIFAFSDRKALQPQQLGDGTIHVYTWSIRPENWMETCGYDPAKDVTAARKELSETFHDWHPQLQKYTQVGNANLEPRNLYMLPIGVRWDHRQGYTLIGDAAHLMSPFAGEGVNLAMRDSMNLAKAIIDGVAAGTLDDKVKEFEEEMFVRAPKYQQETQNNMDALFKPGPDVMRNAILAMADGAPEEVLAEMRKGVDDPRQGP